MMKGNYFLVAAIAVLFLGGLFVLAQDDPFDKLTYPIPELGNCTDKEDCLNYCDNPDNMASCVSFAQENDLLPAEDIALAKKMLEAGQTEGPGGCRGAAECQNYCDDISHIRECIAFAEENNLIPADELAEAKKVASAIERGVVPPPCNSKSECDVVCRKPENMKVCMTFAKEAGLMPPEELAEVEKVLAAIEKGVKPPACGGKEECDQYCALPGNFEECITFAEAAGFVSAEEAAMARKTGGKGPGGCRGKEQCEAFCDNPANGKECVNFAEEFGFMSREEAEQARTMLAKGLGLTGPGGCKGKEVCEAFCDDVSHMAECVDFAEKAGFMSSEDAARARKMAEMGMSGGPGGCKGEEECRAFCEEPANTEECLNFSVQVGDMTSEEAEKARQGMEMMQRGGPGGCRGEEECRAYCDDPSHGQECLDFSVQQGIISPEEATRMQEMQRMQQMQPNQGMMPGGTTRMMPPEGMVPPEGMMPEGGFTQPPSQEDIRMIQEQMMQEQQQQMQQQIEQQIQEQMQQTAPAPESFFEKAKKFLGSIISALEGK